MNFLYSLYYLLPNFAKLGIAGKAINVVLLKIMKRIFDFFIPAYLKRTSGRSGHGINKIPRDTKYIVSLTSFPGRINDVWISIETILRQTFKPDMVILWLAEEQFPDRMLPESLTALQKRGLTIKFCEDLKSHKKYYYTFLEYPDAIIITVDDDSYYPKNLLQSLVDAHKKYPSCICANRAHKITFSENNTILPYRKWKHNYKGITSPHALLVPTGVGGVLYPPGSLHKTIFDKDVFNEICFYADDLWLKANALMQNTKVVTTPGFNKDLIAVSSTQSEKLVMHNSHGGGNDEQFRKIIKHFDLELTNTVYEPPFVSETNSENIVA